MQFDLVVAQLFLITLVHLSKIESIMFKVWKIAVLFSSQRRTQSKNIDFYHFFFQLIFTLTRSIYCVDGSLYFHFYYMVNFILLFCVECEWSLAYYLISSEVYFSLLEASLQKNIYILVFLYAVLQSLNFQYFIFQFIRNCSTCEDYECVYNLYFKGAVLAN